MIVNRRKDSRRFSEVMASLNEVFGNGEVTPRKVEVYFQALEPYPLEGVERAVANLIRHRTIGRFPTPGEIAEEIDVISRYQKPPELDEGAGHVKRLKLLTNKITNL